MQNRKLLLCPSVPVIAKDGKYIFDIKFVEGVRAYASLWRGPVKCIMQLDRTGNLPFGAEYRISDLPFEVNLVDYKGDISGDDLSDADIVLASGDNFELLHISELCKELEIPCVYIIELIPETRWQIVKFQQQNIIKLLKTNIWLRLQECRRLRAFKQAAGLQANGMPAYVYYKGTNKNTVQYFDTRMKAELYSDEQKLKTKEERFDNGEHLRLIYSGRLEKIKGADHLVPIAIKLKALGVPFTLEIYGVGSLETHILEQIGQNNLTKNVICRGGVDFETELVPILQNKADLFICCHRQADPSCTYLEVLSCGLPIIGYFNKAFKGILDLAKIGDGTTIGDIDGMADKILYMDNNKKHIIQLSKNALDFAKNHNFENVFNNRINHLSRTVRTKTVVP